MEIIYHRKKSVHTPDIWDLKSTLYLNYIFKWLESQKEFVITLIFKARSKYSFIQLLHLYQITARTYKYVWYYLLIILIYSDWFTWSRSIPHNKISYGSLLKFLTSKYQVFWKKFKARFNTCVEGKNLLDLSEDRLTKSMSAKLS